MSVIKAMRGESTMQFVDTARKLEAHTFSVVTKAPKRYGPYLLYKLMALATTVHDEVRAANNIYPKNQHEAQMRSFHGKVERGEMALSDIRNSIDSYHGHMKRGNSFKVRERTNQYFKSMFGFYPNKKGWESNVSNVQRRRYSGYGHEPGLGQKAG